MLERILRAIAKAIDTTFALMRFPFQYIFGGLFTPNTPPAFTPMESTSSLADRLSNETKGELERTKDKMDTLIRYCDAEPSIRETFDLSPLKPEVRNLLIGMDSNELLLIKKSPLSIQRKFANGEPHGVEGIPTVQAHIKNLEEKRANESGTLADMKKRLKAYAQPPSPSY